MERASHLLETTSETVESIAEQVGYTDVSAFCRVVAASLGGRRGRPEPPRAEESSVNNPSAPTRVADRARHGHLGACGAAARASAT